MKKFYYVGLCVFIVGIILLFIREIKPSYFSELNDIYIDLMWPIGMIMYSLGLLFERKKSEE